MRRLVLAAVLLWPAGRLGAQAPGCTTIAIARACATSALSVRTLARPGIAADTALRGWRPATPLVARAASRWNRDAWRGLTWGALIGAAAGGLWCAVASACDDEGDQGVSVLAAALSGGLSGAVLGALVGVVAGAARDGG